jgi:hypothetical protein
MERSFPYLLCVLALSLALACSVAAQATAPSGPYGFVVNASQIDSAGANGGALIGIMNFDGAGNVSGNAILKPRNPDPQQAQAVPTALTGTYSTNPDGTGAVTLSLDIGFGITFAMVTTEGGQGIQLMQTDCDPCGADFTVQGQAGATGSLSGAMPIALFYPGATGTIPVTLSAGISASTGTPVYTAAAASGNGAAQCPDGSTGTWTASVPALTVVLNGSGGKGNFLASVVGTLCGQTDFETLSGLVTGSTGAVAVNLVLHGTGFVVNGTARSAKGGSLNGSYGFQFSYSPFPAGSVGVAKFDGAGNVTVSVTAVGAGFTSAQSFTQTGTYSVNPDGTGTINLKNASGQAGPSFAFVITDGGSQLLLLRTDNNTGFDVSYGTGRLQ